MAMRGGKHGMVNARTYKIMSARCFIMCNLLRGLLKLSEHIHKRRGCTEVFLHFVASPPCFTYLFFFLTDPFGYFLNYNRQIPIDLCSFVYPKYLISSLA